MKPTLEKIFDFEEVLGNNGEPVVDEGVAENLYDAYKESHDCKSGCPCGFGNDDETEAERLGAYQDKEGVWQL